MAAGSTYTPIATTTLGSATSNITFTSISGSYTDLILVFNGTTVSSGVNTSIQLNNDGSSLYGSTVLDGNGTSAVSARYTNNTFIYCDYYGGGTGAGSQKNFILQFNNYSNTTTFKSVLIRANLPSVETVATVGLYRSTSAITQIKIYPNSGNFDIGTTATLYGIAAA